jgi:opacity protein-like surface antigen
VRIAREFAGILLGANPVNKGILFAAAVAATAFIALPAAAADYYFEGAVGVSVGGKADATVSDSSGTVTGDIDYDTGALVSLTAGKAVHPNVRLEGELQITDNGLKDTDLRMQHVALLGNVLYDFKPDGKVSPYVGAGVGFGRAIVELDNATANDTGLAWQLRAGVNIRQSDRMVWDIGYRYVNQGDFNASEDGVSVDLAGDVHVLSVGIRFGG